MPENGDPLLLPLLLLNAAGFTSALAWGGRDPSMLGDIIDENECLLASAKRARFILPALSLRKHPTPWATLRRSDAGVLRAVTPASDPR